MTRRRLTWNGRMASAPPAMPGYQEPSVHPAAYPDPEADAYENGDTSSWAEDPHPGPYPNTFHPALPGTEAPMGHPATDPAHYFPPNPVKQASRQLRAAMEAKAAKCIRIAQSMLGRKATVSAIEDQALDLMNLTERQIAAALSRLSGDEGMAQDVPGETASADLLAVENMTLTPERTSEDLEAEELLANMMAEDAGHMSDEQVLAKMIAEEKAKMSGMHMASRKRAFGAYDEMPGDQNDPAHYNFRAEGVLASKKSEDAEAEEMMAEMEKEEAKKEEAKKAASLRRQAKKSEEEAKAEETETAEEDAPEASKKAAHFKRLAAYWERVAKKSEETETAEEEAKAEEEVKAEEESKADKKAAARKAAIRRLAGLEMSAEAQQALAALLKAEGEEPVADEIMGEDLPVEAGEEPMADDFMRDDMGLEDSMLMDDSGVDELSALYGARVAKKSEDEKAGEDEKDAEETEAKAEKKAAVRPQPRKASNGVKTVGAVAKVASSDVNDLSRLWESAPDVSKIFG